MEQHDRTFLELLHVLLFLTLLGVGAIASGLLGAALGGAPLERLLAGVLVGGVASLAYIPLSRLLYRATRLPIDENHARRLQRSALVLGALVGAFGFALGVVVLAIQAMGD